MERLAVDPVAPSREVIARAADVIRRGGLVAMPTETVYGLAANALDKAAVARVFAAKGRPSFNPLIVHVADVADLPRVARDIPPVARDLAARFWPGPLTLVLHRQPIVPDIVTGGSDTVGVRVPGHAVARALIRAVGSPLAAPSANRFMQVSPTTADHVAAGLGDVVDLILDAGATAIGIESTVVDLTTTPPRHLRPGGVTREALRLLLPALADAAVYQGDAVRPAPGMIARHYAPATTLTLFDSDRLVETLAEAQTLAERGVRVVVVARNRPHLAASPVLRLMPSDAAGYAHDLYDMLHSLDAAGMSVAFVEAPPAGDAWEAIRDRLERAGQAHP